MKHYTKLFFAAAIAALGLASCAKEVAPVETPKDNLVTVHFGATAGIEGATKATLTPNEDETFFTSAWENGNVLSVKYISPETADNKIITATWTGSSFEAKGLPNETGAWDYRACYPAPDPKGSHIDFGANRTQNGNSYNSIYDVMIGNKSTKNSAAGKDDDGRDIVFNMDRKTAVAYFHLTDGPANEDLVSATLSVEGGFIASQHAYISDFAFAPTEDLKEITITFPEKAPKASDFQLWFNVLPTTYTKMTLTVETTNNTLTISRTATDKYDAGKLYKVSKSTADKWVKKGGETPDTKDFVLVTSVQSDWSGSYLLVGTNDVNYYAFNESISVDNSWGKCSEVVVENNTIASTYGAMALEIVPGTTENTYSILTPSGKYLSASAKGAFNLLEKYAANNCDFTISFGENNAIVIKQASSTNRQIRYNYNKGIGGLRWYDGTTVSPVYLYKGPSKTALETPADLQVSAAKVVSWDAVNGAASYDVTIGTETFTSETNSYNASALADEYYDVTVVAVPSDKDNYKNSAAATLTNAKFGAPTLATPTLKEGAIDGASISVSWSVDKRATAGYNCELFKDDVKIGESKTVNAGAVTFTGLDAETAYIVKVNAIAVEGAKAYAASPVATLDVSTKAASATANDGSLERPYTAAEAIAAIDANTGLTGKYVKGIVKATPSFNATYSSLTYDIESGENTLSIYSGKDLGNAGFVGTDDLKVGDEVVVYGDLKKYNNTYELDKNNYLISINGETQIYRGLAVSEPKTAFTVGDDFEFGGKVLQVWRGKEDVDETASATFSGYNMSTEGKQTVTVTVGNESVTYEITVNPAGTVLEKSETITLKNGKFSNSTITWSGASCSFVQEKGKSSAAAPNKNYISAPRWYASNVITFKANSGYKITKVVVTCTSNTYANALQGATYTPNTTSATASNAEVTITTVSDFTITMKNKAFIKTVVVYYTD